MCDSDRRALEDREYELDKASTRIADLERILEEREREIHGLESQIRELERYDYRYR